MSKLLELHQRAVLKILKNPYIDPNQLKDIYHDLPMQQPISPIKEYKNTYDMMVPFKTLKEIIDRSQPSGGEILEYQSSYMDGMYASLMLRKLFSENLDEQNNFLNWVDRNKNPIHYIWNKIEHHKLSKIFDELRKELEGRTDIFISKNDSPISFLSKGITLNHEILKESIKMDQDITVFRGAAFDNFSKSSKVTYFGPLSTSLDIGTALHFLTKKDANRALFQKKKDVTDICCLYQYILPAGYPITLVNPPRGIQNCEAEILLPWYLPDQNNQTKFNEFQVIGEEEETIRFSLSTCLDDTQYFPHVIEKKQEEDAKQSYLNEIHNQTTINKIKIIKLRSTLF